MGPDLSEGLALDGEGGEVDLGAVLLGGEVVGWVLDSGTLRM